MRIAVISDIHGNLPALESVMKDISKRGVDTLVCLGDLIGKGPNSEEVIDICRNECDIIVKGNWDDEIYKAYLDVKNGIPDVPERILWFVNSASPQHMEYLGSLPHSAELRLGEKLVRFFHAHPKNFNRYFQNSPVENRLELFDSSDSDTEMLADVAVYGDIHNAYLQILQGRYLINAGSVGSPLDINQSSYVILEADGETFDVRFMRIKYDIERAVALAVRYNVPDLDGQISELRTAKYFPRG